MEPKGRAKNFFGQVMGPIAAPNMQQFVTGNCGLESRVHGWETVGQKDYRSREAKSYGRIYVRREAELRAGVDTGAHFFENGGGFSKLGNWGRCLPELAKFQKSHRKNRESCGDSHEN